ncbi:MAG: 4Fe-4S binding protein [Thermacetogeniaceae bacterium]|nr:4Fe-4S binding protein [Thermoanaerobacterales bacterium]NLN22328.1 4Fe-4S binding protein [Syntrophomonadaceae bacterium]HAF17049.1 4Fe-4S ferredoxin [Peptococcaceae bacterium]
MAEEKKKYKFTFKIVQDLCMDCASCWYVCTYEGGSEAIDVSYNGGAFFVIDEGSCIRCGRCYRSCPVKAVERIKNA